MLESGQGRVWLVKVRTQPSIPHVYTHLPSQDPEFPNGALVQIRRRGRTARQDPDLRRAPGAAPCIIVLIPSDDCGDGDIYELDIVGQDVHNQVVIAERAKAPSGAGWARTTIMTGKMK